MYFRENISWEGGDLATMNVFQREFWGAWKGLGVSLALLLRCFASHLLAQLSISVGVVGVVSGVA